MFELKRKEHRLIPVNLNGEEIYADATLGLARYQDYLRFKSQLEGLSLKITGKGSQPLDAQTVGLFDEMTRALLRCVFRPADADKVMAYFEHDSQEIIESVTPFVLGEFQQAVKEEAAKRSEEKLNGYLQK